MIPTICIIGGTSVDTIIHLAEFPTPRPQTLVCQRSYRAVGSTGAGKAFNLSALGLKVCLHTVLGEDAEAQLVREASNAAGVTLLAQASAQPTEQHVNLMNAEGQRLSIFCQPPPNEVAINWGELQPWLEDSHVVVINILNYCRPVLGRARQLGKTIWTDLHDYDGHNPYHQDFIDAADVLFLSSDNLPDYRDFMQQAIAQGKQLVVCTHGKAGASLLSADGEWIEQAAFPVTQVVDTNGAGDAFFAGFLYGYSRGENLRQCLALAAACGALCVGSEQLAMPGLNAEHLWQMVQGLS